MKLKTLLPVLAIFLFFSCKKDFLEEKPFSFLAAEDLYGTDAGLQSQITGAWGIIASPQAYGATYPLVLEMASGGWYNFNVAFKDVNALTFTASSTYMNSSSPFFGFYKTIISANDIIANAQGSKASDAVKTNVLGQAYLLRAMSYFNLVRMFGDVPLRLMPITKDDLNLSRTPKADVYNQIIKDLEEAKKLLPLKAAQTKGRPARFAAAALLGKVYIAMAGEDNSSPFWSKAKEELLSVVQSAEYSLVSNFATLWDVSKPNTSESIIEIQYSLLGVENSRSNWYTPRGSAFTPLATNPTFGHHRPNKETYSWHAVQYPGDPRINATYIYDSYPLLAGGTKAIWPKNKTTEGFPYIKKYIDPAFTARTTNCNFIYLRYADVLLSLAEVENEMNGPDMAYQYVNQVLDRARKSIVPTATQPADFSGMNKDEFRKRILLERRYEMMGECHLWYDTRRKGEAYLFNYLKEHNEFNINGGLNLSFDFVYPYDKKFLLLPIPQDEINANTALSQADQNQGY